MISRFFIHSISTLSPEKLFGKLKVGAAPPLASDLAAIIKILGLTLIFIGFFPPWRGVKRSLRLSRAEVIQGRSQIDAGVDALHNRPSSLSNGSCAIEKCSRNKLTRIAVVQCG
jgi:hypothetical protein